MPKLIKCTFLECNSEVVYDGVNNKEMSFFKYPINDRNRCEKWVRASHNPIIEGLFAQSVKALGERKVCEKHFFPEDIISYDYKKLLHSKAVPLSGHIGHSRQSHVAYAPTRPYRVSGVAKSVTNKRKSTPTPTTPVANSIEIIEIQDRSQATSKRRRNTNGNASIEIIEINTDGHRPRRRSQTSAYAGSYSKFLMGHELFKLKREETNGGESEPTSDELIVAQFDDRDDDHEITNSLTFRSTNK